MEGIPIDQETLNRFEAQSHEDHSTDPGEDTATEQLNEVAKWLLKTADTALASYTEGIGGTPQEVEKIKWDEESRERLSELSVIVAKRNFSDAILRNSPEMFLGTLLTGKIVEVGIVISQINRRQSQQSEPQNEGEDG